VHKLCLSCARHGSAQALLCLSCGLHTMNDSAHDFCISCRGKTIFGVLHVLQIPEPMHNLVVVRGLHRNHMLLIIMLMILHVLQAKPFLLFCMFCNTRAKMHTILVSFVACTEITEIARFDSAHDFWMFCRQNNFFAFEIWRIWAIFSMENPCIFRLKFGKILPKNK
jgi:hypothetical protein